MMRNVSYLLNMDTLRIAYFAHFQSLINYDIMFWGSLTTMCNLFLIQKRTIRIRLGLGTRSSCQDMFKKLDILTVSALLIFAVIIFVVRKPDHFKTISSVHSIDMRQRTNYIYHQWNFLQTKVCYLFSINMLNKSPLNISKFHRDTITFFCIEEIPCKKSFVLIRWVFIY